MSYFRERRGEILGGRRRRPKTGDRVTLREYRERVESEKRARKIRSAARRLERALIVREGAAA